MIKLVRVTEILLLTLATLATLAVAAQAKEVEVTTQGSCAVIGMTAEQSQQLALQRARSAAIEKAAGMRVSSSTLVTEGKLAADFIRTFSRGFIVREEVRWLPIDQYHKAPSAPPIPVYGVELTATVSIPGRRVHSLGLRAALNQSVFRAGEKAGLIVRTVHPARIAVFNLMADGQVMMLFPSDASGILSPGSNREVVLPPPDSGLELVMATLPGHARDAEGFLVAAMENSKQVRWGDVFKSGEPMPLERFFARYASLAEATEDVVLAYEVFESGKKTK